MTLVRGADPIQTQVASEINHLNNRSAHLDAENAASTVDRAIYFCSFVFQEIGEQLKRTKLPVLELWDKLTAQSESAKPSRPLLASRTKRFDALQDTPSDDAHIAEQPNAVS
jgi:hypothetical protein